MRTAALTLLCFVAFGYAMNAQRFSLLPQVGFENSKTKISYNDLSSFSPLGVKFSPQASLRLNYASRQGHGFFLGIASSRSIVSFNFADPETGMNNFTATSGNMQFRFEGGYQFNSKPIYFNKSKQSTSKKKNGCSSFTRSSCAKSYSSHSCCASNKKSKEPALAKNKGSWVRIQPSVGLGYIPAVKTDVISKSQGVVTSYEYRAGNWNTALIAGTGFEFGRKNTRLFTVSINYFKGIGNLNTQTVSAQTSVKTSTAFLQSAVSGWNLKVGIPFSLSGKKSGKDRMEKKTIIRKTNCQQYKVRYRCGGG
jgi:hypothetical protein